MPKGIFLRLAVFGSGIKYENRELKIHSFVFHALLKLPYVSAIECIQFKIYLSRSLEVNSSSFSDSTIKFSISRLNTTDLFLYYHMYTLCI